jgi:hypothetical protein
MTDKTHLNELLDETMADLGKKLVAEFIKLVRDPETPTSNYSIQLRALLDEHLQSAYDAPG